jgi:hypothetical protein
MIILLLILISDVSESFVPFNDLDNINNDKIMDSITQLLLDFDKLIITNVDKIPDIKNSKFYKHPYYEKFPYDINDSLINFIKGKLIGSIYENDKIVINKDAYEIYYNAVSDTTCLQECVFNIDVTNNTHFFVRKLQFYVKFNDNGTYMAVISLNVDGTSVNFNFKPYNNNISSDMKIEISKF